MLSHWYERRLERSLTGRLPRHIALVMDGNRRWARSAGHRNPSVGHRVGAEHVEHVLGWCERLGVEHLTVFVASTDNLTSRASAEIDFLMSVVEDVLTTSLARPDSRWRLKVAGRVDVLPDSTARALKDAVALTDLPDRPHQITVAIGYGGRDEIVDAVRDLLDAEAAAGTTITELAASLTTEAIAAHLYTAGTPDPDVVIRTSGEQRLSGFLLWQSTQAELQFVDAYWPAFRYLDLLRALRSAANRRQRMSLDD